MTISQIIQAYDAQLLTAEEATEAIKKLIEQQERFMESQIVR